MGKLGKKARKFAKKHLQSVLKKRRKIKAIIKRRSSSKGLLGAVKDEAIHPTMSTGSICDLDDSGAISLDAIFSEDGNDMGEDTSEDDGYLSEGSWCQPVADDESETDLEEKNDFSALAEQNRKICLELAKQKEKLDRLKEKDPKFSEFMESHGEEVEQFGIRDMGSDDDGASEHSMQSKTRDDSTLHMEKKMTRSCVKSWIQLAAEQNDLSALSKLLNGYRAACCHGNQSAGINNTVSGWRIQSSEAFCDILMFMLHNADNIFREQLGISSNSHKRSVIMDLINTSKWKLMKPLVKSYLKSTLVLLDLVTVPEILAFALTRLRASLLFFAAFPYLLQRLIKDSVHLWATGQGTVSSSSFLIIRNVTEMFSTDCFSTCLIKSYKAFIRHCSIVESGNMRHLQFLRDSLVDLWSMDVHKSMATVLVSIQQLGKILMHGLQTKKKENLKTICSWQYINCVDLWVMFISMNAREYDLQELVYMVIQIINGVASLFSGPRYLPLRLKCTKWLNSLSSSSGIFIPVSSFVLDMLEYNIGKDGVDRVMVSDFSCALKLPKNWLKSQRLQEDCVLSAIELLSVHFSLWSYHISFPELASIPLMRLKRFYEKTTTENLRRVVKRFIDRVDNNVVYVEKKREEVAFSPKDEQSVESFLQQEKCSGNTSFIKYYTSVIENAATSRSHAALNENKRPGAF